MSDFNQQNNRAVWFDIPVVELDRAIVFYRNVLAVGVNKQKFDEYEFAVLDHEEGNGGCLVPNKDEVTDKGIMVYFNVEGRIASAEKEVSAHGGKVLHAVHSIGPHGFRSIVLDSEGNRIVLHSTSEG